MDEKSNSARSPRALAVLKELIASNAIVLLLVLVILIPLFAILNDKFLSIYNLSSMLSNMSYVGVIAAAETVVMVAGYVDISVGGVIGMVSCLVAFMYKAHISMWWIILLCLAAGALFGLINGFFSVRISIDSLIVTLGTMAVTQGIGFVISNNLSTVVFEDVLGLICRSDLFGIPTPLILMILVFAIFGFLMRFTLFGRTVYLVGVNREAAYRCGVNTERIGFLAFLLCGLFASIGGLLLTGLAAAGMPQFGFGEELNIISAVVLGGAAIGGGKGSILGTLAGVLTISIVFNGLTMINVPTYLFEIVRGSILLFAVASYELRARRA
jgi:ribose/xylose/arabinose/galactoside ABC-type transport system permease subunit